MKSLGDVYRSARSGAAPAAKSLLFRSGALGALRTLRPSDNLAILRYHAICGPEGYSYASPGICISPAAFEEHVKYLASNYAVVSLPEAVQALRNRRKLPPNAVAITFDDGYADNLPAARVLRDHGLTATFYITAGCLADGQPFWPAELRMLLDRTGSARITMTIGGSAVEIPCAEGTQRAAAVGRLTKLFKSHTIPERERLREQLRALAGHPVLPRVMLTWEELAEMHRLGMTIGAHTVTHPNLPNAGSVDARAEIVGSKARLEQEIGAPVTMFSYPNGGAERYMTPEIAALVREAGFAAATTSWNGFANAGGDLFALERVQVSERLEDLVFALEVERFILQPAPRQGESR